MASKRDPILVTMSNEYVLAYAEGAEVTANNKWPKEIKLLSFQMMTKPLLDPAIRLKLAMLMEMRDRGYLSTK